MELYERLEQMLNYLDLTPEAFCRKLDIDINFVNDVKAGKITSLSDELVSKIEETFIVFRAGWLKSDEGEMLK